MKKSLFLLCMITLAWSCSSGNDNGSNPEPINPNPKEYIVSLSMAGEISDIEESPLSKGGSTDLYGVQVHSRTSTTKYEPYSYGLFDNKSGMTIKLLEGYKYKFQAILLPNSSNKLYYFDSGYNAPFMLSGGKNVRVTNLFINSSEYMKFINMGATYMRYEGSTKLFDHPNTDRYYGEVNDYNPSDNGNVSINMKRVSFGVKIIAEGLTEGRLIISLKEAPLCYINSEGPHEMRDTFTFSNTYPYSGGNSWSADNYTETIPIFVSWEKANGAVTPLINKEVTFKRNTLTTITIKVKDTSIDNGIDMTQESSEMIKGEDITLESGTGLDNNVNPN